MTFREELEGLFVVWIFVGVVMLFAVCADRFIGIAWKALVQACKSA